MITPEELDYIRTAAIGDMLGDSKALDEMGSAATIFRLCRELEHAQNEKTELQEVVDAAHADFTIRLLRGENMTPTKRARRSE